MGEGNAMRFNWIVCTLVECCVLNRMSRVCWICSQEHSLEEAPRLSSVFDPPMVLFIGSKERFIRIQGSSGYKRILGCILIRVFGCSLFTNNYQIEALDQSDPTLWAFPGESLQLWVSEGEVSRDSLLGCEVEHHRPLEHRIETNRTNTPNCW